MRGREHFDGQIEQRARKIVRASRSMPASTVMKPVEGCEARSLSARRVAREHAAVPRLAVAAKTRSTVKNSRLRASLGDRYSTFASLLGLASAVSMFRICSSDMEETRADRCANPGRIAVNDCPVWVCGTALAAAAISSATSKTIRCMITPKGCDHAMGSRGGQGFLCVSCRACSSAMATALAQLSVSSFPAQRSRKASAARVRQPASRSRSPWSRHRYSVRASKPKVYRKIASSEGGALVSVICPDYRTEMGVFHGPEGAAQHGRNRGIAPGGKAYPQRGV